MRRTLQALIVAAVVALPAVASAQATLVGTFNAAGSANLTRDGANYAISFGSTSTVPAETGIFASIPIGIPVNVQSTSLASGPTSIPNFLQVPGYTFSLSRIAAGSAGSANCSVPVAVGGQRCTPAGSGLTFTNVGDESSLDLAMSFNFSGTVTTPNAGTYNFTGVFTSQLPSTTYQEVIGRLGEPQASQPLSYSVTIRATSTVPEPATVTLLAGGLVAMLGMGLMRRRNG